MPPRTGSPARPPRLKRESMTITRSVGKALVDVMNKDKDSRMVLSSTDSEANGTASSPTRTRAATVPKPIAATTRDGQRAGRPSLDVPRSNSGSDKSTPKLMKRPQPSPALKPTTRSQAPAAGSAPSVTGSGTPSKPSEKSSKSRASLTLRGLSSALQPKPSLPPSALPKYKPKSGADPNASILPSGVRKRLSDWDAEKAEDKDGPNDDAKTSNDDGDDEFVTVDRPISPLPRRATRKTVLPISLSLTPSTPPKRANVLHKVSSSLSSTPPRAQKVAKTSTISTSPVTRLRPSSSASVNSQRATPVQNIRKPASTSRVKTTPSARPTRRRPLIPDSPLSGNTRLESSPGNPFQLPETSGSSLLSPPLSPFLESVSLDSIDAGDVSALLSSVVSPTKPTPAPSRKARDAPPQTSSHSQHIFPEAPGSPPPQTPVSSRSMSTLTTDPRQSVLSLRQFLESSGDLEHLLSQPLPSILTPDARERLLSFGFSSGLDPPPFPAGAKRPEPQTPCPVPDERAFTSISQVLFPSAPAHPAPDQQHAATLGGEHGPQKSIDPHADANLLELLKVQLASAESQRMERGARIESLERELTLSREAREREAAELSTQVTDLEERLQGLLVDREREAERRANEIAERLRDKDTEWELHITSTVAQVQEQGMADRDRLVRAERRKGWIQNAALGWESVRGIACTELELVRSNQRFVEIILAGLDVSMQQLRLSSDY